MPIYINGERLIYRKEPWNHDRDSKPPTTKERQHCGRSEALRNGIPGLGVGCCEVHVDGVDGIGRREAQRLAARLADEPLVGRDAAGLAEQMALGRTPPPTARQDRRG